MSASRVARFEEAPRLGRVRIFAITYSENGVPMAHGFARGDELDEWVRDLEAAGWTVEGLGDEPC